MKKYKNTFEAPFLKSVVLADGDGNDNLSYPWNIPALTAEDFEIKFTRPVTILVGVNGSGKSTILEALAAICGFGRYGGSKNHFYSSADEEKLSRHLRASWLPKITRGFYTRAETFQGFVNQIDRIADESGSDIYNAYGGKSLSERSHGEAYLDIFKNRLVGEGIYILDEPEAALAPSRQIEFLRLVRKSEMTGKAQFIIATHSPMIMAYPNATVLHLTDTGIFERSFTATEHFRTLREFFLDHSGFMDAILGDLD